MKVSDILRAAKEQGLCKGWQRDFKENASVPYLCAKFFEGSDWAMEHDFPTAEMLRSFDTRPYGLFVDHTENIKLTSILNRRAYFGNSNVRLEILGFAVCELYARHNTKITLTAKHNSHVVLNILDNVTAVIEAQDEARVNVYVYSENANITTKGNVKIWQR